MHRETHAHTSATSHATTNQSNICALHPPDNLWGGGLPDASWIDAACGGRPAMLMRMDSHLALVNSAALALAGVGADAVDPSDGVVDREEGSGRPTGIVRWVGLFFWGGGGGWLGGRLVGWSCMVDPK
jgi:predicted amidohydrolase YtcJ